MKIITFVSTGTRFGVREIAHLDDMKARCPVFFQTPLGECESYTVYRGQLIVQNTVTFTGCKPERKTTMYLYLLETDDPQHAMPDLFCCGWADDMDGARERIDQILESGLYQYQS